MSLSKSHKLQFTVYSYLSKFIVLQHIHRFVGVPAARPPQQNRTTDGCAPDSVASCEVYCFIYSSKRGTHELQLRFCIFLDHLATTRGGKGYPNIVGVTFSANRLQLASFLRLQTVQKTGPALFPRPTDLHLFSPSTHIDLRIQLYHHHEVRCWNHRFTRHWSYRLCSHKGFRSLDHFAEHDGNSHLHFHEE